jgi:hypothetical protein
VVLAIDICLSAQTWVVFVIITSVWQLSQKLSIRKRHCQFGHRWFDSLRSPWLGVPSVQLMESLAPWRARTSTMENHQLVGRADDQSGLPWSEESEDLDPRSSGIDISARQSR